jgi:hypothetical protein
VTKLPLYHEAARDGRGGIPAWWFGAPFVGFAYAFLVPRFVPDVVALPDGLPQGVAPTMRWFIGLLLGVALLSAWRVVRWARSPRVPRH